MTDTDERLIELTQEQLDAVLPRIHRGTPLGELTHGLKRRALRRLAEQE